MKYVAERPEISQPVAWGGRPLAPWMPYLVGGMLMLIAPLFLLPLRRQYLLLSEGRAAPGRIIEVKKPMKGAGGEIRIPDAQWRDGQRQDAGIEAPERAAVRAVRAR